MSDEFEAPGAYCPMANTILATCNMNGWDRTDIGRLIS